MLQSSDHPPPVVPSIGAVLGAIWLDVGEAFIALSILAIFDFVTGVVAALLLGEYTANLASKGIKRKALKLLLIPACAIVARYFAAGFPPNTVDKLAPAVGVFLAVAELSSIIENLNRAGVISGSLSHFLAQMMPNARSSKTLPSKEDHDKS